MMFLTLFNQKYLYMSKKNITFANENDEPTALANYSGKPIPTLTGEVAERFVRMAEENERIAKERAKEPLTKKKAENELSFLKMLLKIKEDEIKECKDKIKELEDYIKSFNG